MRYVLGIDAGGTKTVGLLADETGQVLAEVRGSGANLQTHGELEVDCPTAIAKAFLDRPTARPDSSCLATMGPPKWVVP